MLKDTGAKLARCPREGEEGLGTSSLGFVKWNKESTGQWKVLGLLREQWGFLSAAIRSYWGDVLQGRWWCVGAGDMGI